MNNLILAITKEICPYCTKGNVFEKRKFLLQIPKMNSNCECCGRDFNGEPGYFFGAMYLSYGIAVLTGIITFLICQFIIKVQSFDLMIGIIMGAVILISYKNFKWSRILWLKIFPPGEGTNFFGGGNKRKLSKDK